MKRLTIISVCVFAVFFEVWCSNINEQPIDINDTIEDARLFHLDDSLLRLVSPESYDRLRLKSTSIYHRSFSHTQQLHYTPNSSLKPYYLIITTPSLYESLYADMKTYAEDVHAIYGYGIILETVSDSTPEQLKSLIIYYQSNLCGVLFIGDLGEAFYEIDNDYGEDGYKNWPCDLFFTDLDGQWSDNDMNGIYDTHTGNVAPEIYLARLSGRGLSSLGDEVTIIKKQLKKSHDFWWKSSFNISDIALNYIDRDWENISDFLSTNLNPIYGPNNVESIKYDSTTVFSPSDYINRLSQDYYGFTLLAAHSNPSLHHLTNGYVYLSNIKYNLSGCYLFNLFCCSACNWTVNNSQCYLGGAYLFNNGATLAVIGSTKVGGMLGGKKLYSQLPSKNIGVSFLYWWKQHCGNYHSSNIISWNYGMTILGDPTIRLGHKVSDVCVNNLSLTSFPTSNTSNLVIYKAGTSINVSGNFIIPQGVHVIFDAPTVTFDQCFTCPVGASFETRNEGCEL